MPLLHYKRPDQRARPDSQDWLQSSPERAKFFVHECFEFRTLSETANVRRLGALELLRRNPALR
jgi:hypothetical protein